MGGGEATWRSRAVPRAGHKHAGVELIEALHNAQLDYAPGAIPPDIVSEVGRLATDPIVMTRRSILRRDVARRWLPGKRGRAAGIDTTPAHSESRRGSASGCQRSVGTARALLRVPAPRECVWCRARHKAAKVANIATHRN